VNQSIALLTVLIIWNLITFLLMKIDKVKAIKNKYRISEKTLFLSAFLLGGLGILCGMYVLRHKTKHTKFKVLVPLVVVVNIFLAYSLFQFVSGIGISHYAIKSNSIPSEFNGFKILQISDLHCAIFGDKQEGLVNKVKAEKPDIIVLTGDMIDEGIGDMESISDLLDGITAIAPVYSVSGNHDKWYHGFLELQKLIEDKNVTLLENKSGKVTRNGKYINIFGIGDPDVWDYTKAEQYLEKSISTLKPSDGYNILLFHRANMFDSIKGKGYQLVLSGHMHGGQIQIPFIGGLVSPHGDWFPKYTQGKYEEDGTVMIVSRGLGNSMKIPRVFNPPELVVVTLRH
jgi:predicted MPP superfamily phosphohydrolase